MNEEPIVEIMKGFDDKDIEKDVEVQRIEPADVRLRKSLLNFVSDQVLEIKKLDDVVTIALRNLVERLQANELSAQETLSVISTLANKKTDMTTAILEPFKASNDGKSPLLAPPKADDATDFEQGLKDMSKEDRDVLERLFRVTQAESNRNNGI
jgi:hypothetical protein